MGNAESNTEYDQKSIFDFTVKTIDGQEVSLSTYKGKKAYLIVNVASQWGLTATNYKELNQLHVLYPDDLQILAFPTRDFGGQEFKTNEEIKDFVCSASIDAKFPVFGRVSVENGDKTEPLFQFLKYKCHGTITGKKILWNFGKFLCDQHGQPCERYVPTTSPMKISEDIEALINK